MTSHDQLSRLMVLIPWLRDHPGAKIKELCEVFGLSKAQVIKDLQVAVMCGLPGGLPDDLIDIDMDMVRGEGVITLANADFLARPMRFTADEARSLIVALQAIAETATGSLAVDASTAVSKLAATVGDGDQIWVELVTGDVTTRETLTQAIAAKIRLKLEYGGETKGETSYPLIDPVRLQMVDSVLYLQAWSIAPDAWRIYRVERIVSAEEVGPASDHGEPPTLDGDWAAEAQGDMVLEVDQRTRWVAEYYPITERSETPDGGLRLRLGVWDESWAIRLLLRLGEHARLVTPIDLAEKVRQARLDALQAYRQLG